MTKIPFNLLMFVCLLAACKNSKETTKTKSSPAKTEDIIQTVEVKNSKESIDWQGMYYNRMNCESPCRGIETTLILSEGEKYTYRHNEIGVENGESVLSGQFIWDRAGRYISLQGNNFQDKVHYLVDKGRLRRMGDMKEELFTERSSELDLVKVKNQLKGTKWKVSEIEGQKISEEENGLNLTLGFEKDGSFFASGGCNSIMGSYFINNNMQINFYGLIMTEKECSYNHYDEPLINALNLTRNYMLIGEDELHLTVGKRSPYAKFTATE